MRKRTREREEEETEGDEKTETGERYSYTERVKRLIYSKSI